MKISFLNCCKKDNQTANFALYGSFCLVFILLGSVAFGQKKQVKSEIDFKSLTSKLVKQAEYGISLHTDSNRIPRSFENGKMNYIKSDDWCSGFYAGNLWYLSDLVRAEKVKGVNETLQSEALKFTHSLSKEQYNTGTHDLGFMMFCSFGNALREKGNAAYKPILVNAANSLAKRFSPKTNAIRSWGALDQKENFLVIVDNMMNLELLFWAAKETKKPELYNLAVTHANTTLKNHFRADGSSYHVINYDQENGSVIKKYTHQGANDSSSWARGQGWGLYGFTMCYRFTKDKAYLDQANKIANYILSFKGMPEDGVPVWDYKAKGISTGEFEPRDASAGALYASALFELADYTPKQADRYRKAAIKILKSLSSPAYLAPIGTNGGFLILHSTGHRLINSEVDVPLNYADYYYLEALNRYKKLISKKS